MLSHDKRDRSRDRHRSSRSHRDRSKSPSRHHHHKRRRSRSPAPAILLPSNAAQLHHRNSLDSYFKMFTHYLDIQKSIDILTLDERDMKDRFRRFVSRWNRGELATGWYDKDMLSRTDGDTTVPSYDDYLDARRMKPNYGKDHRSRNEQKEEDRIRNLNDEDLERELARLEKPKEDVAMRDGGDDSDDSDDIGPEIPGSLKLKKGAKVPTSEELILQQELNAEQSAQSLTDHRLNRKLHAKAEKERLDDLLPRAEAGTRECQLEKKREAAATNRSFADAKSADIADVPEATLLGADDSFKQRKAAMERKKNERELRKEAMLLARKEEREERFQVHREKEEQTMKMLKALAEKFR